MSIETFWKIVDGVAEESGLDMELRCATLATRLSQLPTEDVVEFVEAFNGFHVSAYTWELWGAAYLVRGGCSDDAFIDFRSSLISHGQSVFEDVLAAPDSLARRSDEFLETLDFEGYEYTAKKVLEARDDTSAAGTASVPPDPLGEPFDETRASLSHRYPQLWERFGWSEEQEARATPTEREAKRPWWKLW